jgi:hypothetical protein
MNHSKILLIAVVAILFGTLAYASQIRQLELAELPSRSHVIVLAKILRVDKISLDSRVPTPDDKVTIKVASALKGSIKQDEVEVLLQPRGVKDFDPTLKVGDTGVFFLREVGELEAKLAYWGSVAIFQKPNFVVSKKAEEQQALRNRTEWISKCIKRIQSVKLGDTRAELLEVCTTEGGISTRLWRRYVYRECPYIKVDVEFKAIDNDKYEKPEDVITKISKPFLEWSIMD